MRALATLFSALACVTAFAIQPLIIKGLGPDQSVATNNVPDGSLEKPFGVSRVLTWRNGLPGVLTFTHDDNRADHLNLAGPALTARGLRGTFNVNPGLWTWSSMQSGYVDLAAQGHELASHTMYHQGCVIKTPEQDPAGVYFHSLAELEQDCITIKGILDALQAVPTVSFAYPYGAVTDETHALVAQYFLGARLSLYGLHVNPPSPKYMGLLQPSMVGAGWKPGWDDYGFAYGMLSSYLSAAMDQGGWVIEEYHDIVYGGYSGLNQDAYYQHLDDVAAAVAAGKLWVATQGECAAYIWSRDAAQIVPLSNSPERIELQVDDGLNDSVYFAPITIETTIPAEWSFVPMVTQGGAMIDCQVATSTSGAKAVRYSIVPSPKIITISP